MKKYSIRDLAEIALVCAIYVVLTVAISPLSYGSVQFRFSEALILLCFYNKKYGWSLTLGCLIANCFSPLGWIDIVFGTLSTLLPVIFICFSKRLIISSLWPTLFVGLIVGAELSIVYELPFFITVIEVAVGEFVCVTLIGYPLFKGLDKNKAFMNAIGATRTSSDVKLNPFYFILIALTIAASICFITLPVLQLPGVTEDIVNTRTFFDIILRNVHTTIGLWYIMIFVFPIAACFFAIFMENIGGFVISTVLNVISIVVITFPLIFDRPSNSTPLYWFIIHIVILLGIIAVHAIKTFKKKETVSNENVSLENL